MHKENEGEGQGGIGSICIKLVNIEGLCAESFSNTGIETGIADVPRPQLHFYNLSTVLSWLINLSKARIITD